MEKFSTTWKSSKQPRKQRLYRYNAPLHILGSFMNVHLSKELRKKYKRRALRARKGDKVQIIRGQFKGKVGEITKVDIKNTKAYVDKVEVVKKDGTKITPPIAPNHLVIIELNLSDKKRMAKLEKNIEKTKSEAQLAKPEKQKIKQEKHGV